MTDYAIFTDESYKITPDDVIEGGLRWQFEKQYRSSGYTVVLPFGLGTQSQQLVSPGNQHEEYRAWTGLASYTHHFTRDLALCASYGQSFRPGGIVLGISLPLPEKFLLFKPETSSDFEVGSKARLFGGRVRLSADIYHQTYVDYIGRENNIFTSANGQSGPQSITTNGNAIAQGAEASLSAFVTDAPGGWTPTPPIRMRATTMRGCRATIMQEPARPTRTALPRVTGSGVTSNCTTTATLGAPNWYLSLNSEYDMPVSRLATAFVRGLYSFTPANRLDVAKHLGQDPRNIASFYVGARAPEGGWEAFVFVKNAFGVNGSTNLFGEQFDSGFTTAGQAVNYDTRYASSVIVHPRQVGVSLTCRF